MSRCVVSIPISPTAQLRSCDVIKGIMHASTLVLLITSPLNALISYILIHRTRLAFLGAPLSMSITYHLSFILLVAYARWGPAPTHFNETIAPNHISHTASSPTTPDPSQYPTSTANGGSPAYVKESTLTLAIREILAPEQLLAFLRLALPGIIMVGTEWWAFEIVALAAGRLGRLSLAAQSVVMTADQSRCCSPWVPA